MPRLVQKRGRKDKVVGLLLAVLGTLLLATLGGLAWWLKHSKIPIDAASNCPVAGPRSVHVIMIDRSDPITDRQAQRVRQDLQTLKANAQFGTRFDLYTFEGDATRAMTPIVSVCAPGKPEEANALIENPDRARAVYEERFSKPLNAAVDELLRESTQPTSPILESLQGAAQSSFGQLTEGAIPLRLTLVSDLVQHSTAVSHFRKPPDFDELIRSPTWSFVRPRLKGAEVEVLYVLRPQVAHIQNRGHQAYWERIIQASGGKVMKIEPLQGTGD